MNILLTSVGRRSYLVQYFKEALGTKGKVYVSNSSPLTPAFNVAHESVVTPLIYDDDYISFLLDYCQIKKIDVVISLFDIDLPVLSDNIQKFNDIGVKVIVSKKEVIDICNDKFKTYNFLLEHGFNVPKTYISIDTAIEMLFKGEITYPLIIKPRWGMGSIGVFEASNKDELRVFYNKTLKEIKNSYLKFESENELEESIIIQEKLKGQEYGLDIISDLNSNYQTTIVKTKHAMRSGETDSAKTVNNVELKILGEKLSTELNHIGNLDVDVFIVEGVPYVLEMNARFGGGYPFSHMAGVNLPMALIKWANGEVVSKELLKERYNVISHKDITMVTIESYPSEEIVTPDNMKYIVQELNEESAIYELLIEFEDVFEPKLSLKVKNIKKYAEKLTSNSYVYSIRNNKKNVGFVSFYANDFSNKILYISFIGTQPNHRNQGIGNKLLQVCYKKAKELGMEFIKLEVRKKNSTAKIFYEKNGFTYTEDASNESIFMTKIL